MSASASPARRSERAPFYYESTSIDVRPMAQHARLLVRVGHGGSRRSPAPADVLDGAENSLQAGRHANDHGYVRGYGVDHSGSLGRCLRSAATAPARAN